MTERPVSFGRVLTVCCVVLFLFQLLGMSINLYGNRYEMNSYAMEAAARSGFLQPEGNVAVYSAVPLYAVEDACRYLDVNVTYYDSLTDEALEAELIVVGKDVNAGEAQKLLERCNSGARILFSGVQTLRRQEDNPALWQLLGVLNVVSSNRLTKSLRLYDGFLLGGQVTYTDVQQYFPYYQLRAGCRVYGAALLGDPEEADVESVPVMWRVGTGSGFAFVINMDVLTLHAGAGVFSAACAQFMDEMIYPVVNAQALLLNNFPIMAEENSAQLYAYYYQSCNSLFINRLLPETTAALNTFNYPMACTFSGCIDPTAVTDADRLWHYMPQYIRLIIGRQGEMGISAYSSQPGTHAKKLTDDLERHAQSAGSYSLTVLSQDNMPARELEPLLETEPLLSDIQTVVASQTEDTAAYRYINDRVVQLPVTATLNQYRYQGMSDLYFRSMQTCTLSSLMKADFAQVLYPQSADDDWVRISNRWSSGIRAAITPFDSLEKLNVTQSARRARTFLNLAWQVSTQEDAITLNVTSAEFPAYFLYRSGGRCIDSAQGASFTQVETGVYLLSIRQENVTLHTRPTQEIGFR